MPTPDGARLLATGAFTDDDLGVSCFHAKTGAVELYLNHLVDVPGEYVVADCTADADSFASGLFASFDLTALIAEPTRKCVGVCQQWRDYARGYDVALTVVGNKVSSREDEAFLRAHLGDSLLAFVGHEPAIRALEQGRPFDLCDLTAETRTTLELLQDTADNQVRDWTAVTRQTVEFHLKNPRTWANLAVGADLSAQIHPEFTLSWQAAAFT